MNESKVTSSVEHITPQVAAEYLKYNKVNRILNDKTVRDYAERIRTGQWKLNGEAICFNEDGDLVQGQHRLNAIIKANMAIDSLVVRGVAKDCMPTYDNGRSRTAADVFHLSNIPNAAAASSIITKYLSLSKGLLNSHKTEMKKSNMDVLNEYLRSPDYYNDIVKLAAKLYKQYRLYTQSEFGGVIVFLNKQLGYSLDYITTFFLELCQLSDTKICPTTALLRKIIIQDMTSTKRHKSSYKFMLLVKTWNSYVKGTELKSLKWDENREKKIEFQ